LFSKKKKFCSALNLRDVLNVLGLYPGDAGLMGLEFAGISATDQNLRLFGLSGGFCGTSAFAKQVSAKKDLVCTIPECLSFEEASTLPFAFCNALGAFKGKKKTNKFFF
jgi:NADPH:quinone reductase-like Zn-dependent oxidoreductase